MSLFRVRLLGAVEVHRGDEVVMLPEGKQRALLATLALRPLRPVSMGEIAERLWGDDPPPGASTTIRGYVKRLRRLLDVDTASSIIRSGRHGYQLEITPDEIDVHRFRRLTAQASGFAGTPAEAELLRQALALWRGPALCGVRSESLHREVVPALREHYLGAVQRRIELDLGAGEPSGVIAELRQLVDENPLREGLWAQLLRALHGAGRTAEAFAAYEQCREILGASLGVDPGVSLRELHQRMLAEDATPLVTSWTEQHPTAVHAVIPHQLPPETRHFTGRDRELALLDKVLSVSGRAVPSVIIDGGAGVGKTALAVHWAHLRRDAFEDGALYIDLKGYGPGEPLDVATALETLLSGLQWIPRIPADLESRSALFRSMLADKRMLVLLDNARSAEQVRPLLPGAGNTVVVTSRNQLRGLAARDGAERVPLSRLAADEASALLVKLLGVRRCAGESAIVAELGRLCSRLPLALRIVAEHAGRHPDLPLAQCAAELRDRRAWLDTLGGAEGATDLPTVLSWSYAAIPPDAARLFRLLGAHPARVVEVGTAAAIMRTSQGEARRLLDLLAETNLLEQQGPHRFGMDDLLREFTVSESRRIERSEDHAGATRVPQQCHSVHAC